MKRHRRFFFTIVAVLCGAGLLQIFRAVGSRHRAEAALAAVVRPGAPEKTETPVREPTRDLTPPAETLVAKATAPIETLPSTSAAHPDASRLVAAHPEVLALFKTAFIARFDAEYRAYFDQIALSPERVERFKTRLFQDKIDQLDLRWIGQAQGAKRDDPAYRTLRKQQEETLSNDLKTMVGQEGYEALEQFRRANGVRGFVDDLATAMQLGDKPMTLDQQDQLVQTIAKASARFQKGGAAMPWDANWDAIMAQAPGFLTDAQVAALREHGDERVRFVWRLPEFYAQHRPGAK